MIDSFILLIFFHSWPTHFVIKILRWLVDNLSSGYDSKCLSSWSWRRRHTSSLNSLLTNTSTTCTRDVHPGGTLQRDVIFFVRSALAQSVYSARWTSAIKICLEFILLVYGFDHSLFVVRLFLLCCGSKTVSLKDDCRSNPINNICKYSKLRCCLSFVKTWLSVVCANVSHTFNVISLCII